MRDKAYRRNKKAVFRKKTEEIYPHLDAGGVARHEKNRRKGTMSLHSKDQLVKKQERVDLFEEELS